jgi:cyclohexanone monooxygenase
VDKDYEFDAIVFATGFDAMTGALTRINIVGRDNKTLAAKSGTLGPAPIWGSDDRGLPKSVHDHRPRQPIRAVSNMMVSIEQHVDWIADCLSAVAARQCDCIEATQAAQDAWVDHVNQVAHTTLYPAANSWYMGANIEGKPRVFMPYIGGVGAYRVKCDEIAANGYAGFILSATSQHAVAAE